MSFRLPCVAAAGLLAVVSLPSFAQTVSFIDGGGAPALTYLESAQASVRVVDPGADTNPSGKDTVSVQLSAALTSDSEILTLTETGTATGVFEGSIPLPLAPASPGDGRLQVLEDPGPPHRFDTITAVYGAASATAGLTGSRTSFVDIYGRQRTAYAAGSTVIVRVEDHNLDQPGQYDTAVVVVQVPGTGDAESLQLVETGRNTGIFQGSLPLDIGSGGSGDGRLQASPGMTLNAVHADGLGYSSSQAQAAVVSATVDFIDETGKPTAELLEMGTARVRVLNPGANSSPFSADTTTVMLRSRFTADFEMVTLTETGADTSVFEGSIELANGPAQPDGKLATSWGPAPDYLPDTVTAEAPDSMASAQVKGSRLVFLDVFGREVTATPVGDRLRLRLTDHTRDNPQSRDAVSVQVTALQGGDSEPVMLTETGFHTGVFEGSIATELGSGTTPQTLQVYPGDQVEGFSPNTNTPEATRARVQMTGSSVLFVDAQGQPVTEYLESSQAYLRVVSGFANSNPSAPDTTTVRVQTALTGDLELLTLTETGANTGVFTGGIPLRLGPGQTGDGFLETQEAPGPPHEFDLLTATYDEPFGTSVTSAGLTGSRTSFVDAYGAVVTTYPLGARIYVRVEDHNADQPGQFDTVQALVSVPGGDAESLQLLETGHNTGIFVGSLLLESSPGFSSGDGKLQVSSPGTVFNAEHVDALGMTSSKAQARAAFTRIDFIDEAGNPTAELLEAGSARVRVFNLGANSSPFSIDSMTVMLRSRFTADWEVVTLTETGADTSVFEGSVELVAGLAQPDGKLATSWGPAPDYLPDTVTAEAPDSMAAAQVKGSRLVFLDVFGREVTSTPVGDRLRLRLTDHTRDNPQSRDAVSVQVTALQGGDSEPVMLTETGFHTGVFEGSIATELGSGTTPQTLQVYPGDQVEGFSPNTNTPEATRARVLMTGSSVLFVDAQGQPVTEYLESSQAYLRVVSGFANSNPSAPDTTTVRVQTALTGDLELLTLTETGANTGVFTGGIPLRLGPGQTGDGFLETQEAPGPPHEFDLLTATYDEPFGTSVASAGLTGSRTSFVDAYGAVVTTYPLGARVYVRVEDHNADQPGQFDTVQALVSVPGGDAESLQLLETGHHTGIFVGSLLLESSPGFSSGDGKLQVPSPGTVFNAEHVDALGMTSSKAQARAAFTRVDFIDEAGNPTAELLEAGTARVRVFNLGANSSPFSIDSMTVMLRSHFTADWEIVTLTETGADTSVFEGSVELASGPAQPDGKLATSWGPAPDYLPDTVTAEAPDSMASAQVKGSRLVFLDVFGREVASTPVGDRLRLRLTDHTRDNPQSRDAVSVQVTALQGGDSEPVILTETGFHTGVFEGSIATELGSGTTPQTVQVYPGDQVEGFSPNTNTPEATRARVQMTGSSVLFVDAQGQPVTEYLESSQAYLRVVSGFANSNPSAPDTTTVRVQTALTGDLELVTLTETGANTGVFTGGIPLRLGPGQTGDGFLETQEAPGPPHEFDLLTATYDEPFGSSVTSAGLTGSRTSFVDAYGVVVSTYPLGARVYVRVEDHNADQPGQFDTVQALVSVPGGDAESLQLLETGHHTGIFVGSLLLESSPGFSSGDGKLQVSSPGTVFNAEHVDALGMTSSKAQARAAFTRIDFIDEAGNPTAELLEAGTARVRVFNVGANSSPFSIDSMTVMLRSHFTADFEIVTLTETGADTSVFEGSVELASGPAQPDGKLATSWGPAPDYLPDTVTAEAPDSMASAQVKGSRLVFLDVFGREVTATPVGDRLRLRLTDHTRDNPQSRDAVSVQVTALQGGDSEPVMLTETGFHTGVFEGSIATELGSGSTPQTVQVYPGDQVEGFSPNTNTPEATRARVQMTGSSVLFVDAQGQPVTEYLESSRAYLRVVSGFANSNPSAPDMTTVRVQTALTGDLELLTLTETGANTGVFTGSIPLRLGPGQTGDGFLETQEAPGPPHEFDLLTATYDEPFGTSVTSAGLTGSRTSFVDAYGAPVATYPLGARVYVRVEDHNADQPGQVDTVQALVSVPGGDAESLQLTETGPNTGLFLGSLLLESSPGFSSGDGKLQVSSPGIVFNAEHVDALGMTSSKAEARAVFTRVDFIDEMGNPTSELLEAGTARVRVFNLGANSSPFSVDSMTVVLRSRFTGDSEVVALTETGADTSVFEGSIQLVTGPAQPDGRLETSWGPAPDYLPDTVTAEAPDSTATAHLVGSQAWFLNLRGQVVKTYALRSTVRVRVDNPVANNPGQVDILPVLVRSLGAGDEESLTLTETGAATGVFEGTLPSTDAPTSAQNGTLTAGAGEVIELVSPNLNSPEPTRAQATFLATAAPQAMPDSAQTTQEIPVTLSVLANDSGAPPLSVGAVSQAAHGTVAANADGTVTYTPAAGYFGPDAFTYVLVDGQGGEAQAEVTVTVIPSNRAPVATNDTATVAEDGTVNVAVLANDTDPDNDTLSVSAVTQGAHGAVVVNPDKTVKYTPAANYNGSDTFTYTIDDGHSHTATATVSMTVTSVNDAPVAVADSASVAEDGMVNVNVLGNDTDPENDTLSVTSVTQGAHGAVVINPDKTVKYTPAANYNGSDTFTYTISDGNGGSATGTVTMTVTAVNDAPVAVADSASVAEDGTVNVNVLGNDTDIENDTLSVTAVTQGAHGAVVINPDKTVKYTPAANYNGSDTFTYTISDGNGGSATGTVTMTVTAVNDAPVAVADSASVAEDGTVNVNVLGNDTDIENDTLSVTAVTQGAHGAVVINPDKTVKYTPAANYNGTDTFTYTISDGNGGSATGTVTLTITAVNDAPVAVADSASVAEDGTVNVNVLGNDTDPENDTLTVTTVTQGAHGAVVINPDKTVKYTPAANYNGSDTFTYTISDGNGGSATGTVTMTVTAVNDAPVAVADSASVAEDGTVNVNVLGNDTDIENDTLSVTAVTQGAHSAVAINPDKTVKYTPAANYNGSDTFTYTISDGNGGSATGTVTMTVTAVNDAPVAVADSASVVEDGTVNVNVLGNDTDIENDTLSVTAVTQGAHGAVVINPDKTVKYTPVANYNGSDTFTYTISDGHGGSATGTVTMTVTAVNDAPVAVADSASVAEDGTVNVNVLGNDTDIENDTLTVTAVTQGAHGAVVINPDKTVKYTPAANYNGSDAFTYTISDGHGGSATSTVSVTITAVNDAPVVVNDTASTVAEVAVTVSVLANDVDVDGPSLHVTSVTQGAHGSVVINAGQTTVTYTPAANWIGPDSFTYTISDGAGGSATATVSMTVQAPPRVSTNLQVLYPFSEGSGTTVHDTSGVGSPLDLTIGSAAAVTWSTGSVRFNSATLAQTSGNATKVIAAVQASNALTVEAWVTPANLTQTGPAAIVAISQMSNKRDITLGQTTSRYDTRLRTSSSNNAGTAQTTGTGVVTTGLQHVVFTRDSAGNAKTWVNGTAVATSTISGNLSSWVSYKLGLGDELAGGNAWLGTFHLVAIYSRAITAAEIHQNFLAGKDGN